MTMKIETACSELPDSDAAVADLLFQLGLGPDREANITPASLIVVQATSGYDLTQLNAALAAGLAHTTRRAQTPASRAATNASPATQRGHTALHGATSARGVLWQEGTSTDRPQSIGAFALWDPEGDYATVSRAFSPGVDSAETARQATAEALAQIGRSGETPDLVLLSLTEGTEEEVLAGIQSVLGPDVAIVGGTAAADTLDAGWAIFDGTACYSEGLVVTLFFCSGATATRFSSGYSPTLSRGTVTAMDGRWLQEIDHRPAAEVYNEWTDGKLGKTAQTPSGQTFSASAFWPLGRAIPGQPEREGYVLTHPVGQRQDGALQLFSTLHVGDALTQMYGTPDTLVERAGHAARNARHDLEAQGAVPVGALLVYCGGCMMAVRDRLDEVAAHVAVALGDRPFLGFFTFGEQGPMHGSGSNHHGNLMISCVCFGSLPG